MDLDLIPDTLAVSRLSPDAEYPEWLGEGELRAYLRTADEVTVVGEEADVPEGILSEVGWRALKVRGPLDFSMVGVLATLVNPLAEAGISVFVLSTYDTDYVLVKEVVLDRALAALRRVGHIIKQRADTASDQTESAQ